jgi:acetyl esterase/lipase
MIQKTISNIYLTALAGCSTILVLAACSASASAPISTSETTLPNETSSDGQQADPSPATTSNEATGVPAEDVSKTTFLNLWYVPEGNINQRLDVYLPVEEEKPFPTILMIHGGGFRARSKTIYIPIAGHLTELGYAVVSTDYRLTPSFIYPSQVEDVFCALAWIHANHETYGFDDDHVFVWGGSAGGYLAAMLGTVDDPSPYLENCPHKLPESDWVKGVVVFYGFFDVTSIEGHNPVDVKSSLEPFMGGEYSEIPVERLAEMSPISYVDGSEPPFLLIHGTADTSIQSWLSEAFAALLREVGVVVELLLLEDVGHAFELEPLTKPSIAQSLEAVEGFLGALIEQ